MAEIIAITNQKGGVGKTTTCVNLCAALKEKGKSVLLADCDPQGNATTGMGIRKNTHPNMRDLLMEEATILECIHKTPYGDVIPTGSDLASASISLIDRKEREYVLKKALFSVYTDYDYILIDCPPSLELLTINAFTAADRVLIPMQCEYYALEGIADLLNSIRLCKKKINRRLDIRGIVLTMYDARMNLTHQVESELRNHLGDKVFRTVIPRSIRLSEAPSHGIPGVIYDRANKGSRAYVALAEEFLQK